MQLDPTDEALRDLAYDALGSIGSGTPPLVTVQFGAASPSTLEALGKRGYAVQVPLDARTGAHRHLSPGKRSRSTSLR